MPKTLSESLWADYNTLLFVVLLLYYNPLRRESIPAWYRLLADLAKSRHTDALLVLEKHLRRPISDIPAYNALVLDFQEYQAHTVAETAAVCAQQTSRLACQSIYRENGLHTCHYRKVDTTQPAHCVFNPSPEISSLTGYTYLQGIIYLAYFTVGNKRLYLLGEMHHDAREASTRTQINVVDFLLNLPEQQRARNFDYFLEAEYGSRQIGISPIAVSQTGNLGSFVDLVADCLLPDKETQCQAHFPNVRFHYVDIRHRQRAHNSADMRHLHAIYLIALRKHVGARPVTQISAETSTKILRDMTHIKEQKAVVLTALLQEYRILRNLKAIADPVLREAVCSIVHNSLSVDFLLATKNVTHVLRDVFLLYAKLVDAYAFTRMLRHFADGSTPRNIIAFLGKAHAASLATWLRQLARKLPQLVAEHYIRTADENTSQIALRGIGLPFAES